MNLTKVIITFCSCGSNCNAKLVFSAVGNAKSKIAGKTSFGLELRTLLGF